jgi:RNA polymerase sigma-70 factor (ECF subfamily)
MTVSNAPSGLFFATRRDSAGSAPLRFTTEPPFGQFGFNLLRIASQSRRTLASEDAHQWPTTLNLIFKIYSQSTWKRVMLTPTIQMPSSPEAPMNDPLSDVGQLLEGHRAYLKLLVRVYLNPRHPARLDASDLVQQTLLEGYRDFAQFQGCTQAEWLAWLRRILGRNLADFVRQYRGGKRQIKREIRRPSPTAESSAHAAFDPADGGESPSQFLLRKERELQVADAVAQLAPEYREVILLRNLQQLEFAEVARRMNRSRPAAQMLWMRALQKLQEHLEPA